MARRRSLSELLRQSRQMGAVSGRPLTQREISGFVSPIFHAEQQRAIAEADIRSRRELQERGLTQRQRQFDVRQKLLEETAEAESLGGLISSGLTFAGTETGGKALTGLGRKVGLLKAPTTTPTLTTTLPSQAPSLSGFAGRVGAQQIGTRVGAQTAVAPNLALSETVQAPTALTPTFGAEAAGTVGTEAALAGGAEAGGVVGAEAGGVTLGGTVAGIGGGYTGGRIGGFVGQKITRAGEPGHMGGERMTGRAIGAAAGAASGFAMLGAAGFGIATLGIGAVIGGVIGAFFGGGGK